jgi:hypothetical protein
MRVRSELALLQQMVEQRKKRSSRRMDSGFLFV